jgi:UDP-N-acetylmuramoyl-L-alanyl-D-glutamate--2,6-diaminopimelate ligase
VAARLGVPAPSVSPGDGDAAPSAAQVTGVTLDSRAVRPGDLYAALPGARAHGADFAAAAAAAGAVAAVTDPAGAERVRAAGLVTYVVADPRAALGALAAWLYGEPARELTLLGITGTNGKTTTAYLVEAGLRAAGHRTGLIGTIETRVGGEVLPSVRTTPEAPDLHAMFATMRERGVTAAVMEVSSHALALGRVDGTVFDVAAFTNLGEDHLDFHVDLESYYAAKAALFEPERAGRGVVMVDDAYGERLRLEAGVPVVTVSAFPGDRPAGTGPVDWRVVDVVAEPSGAQRFRVLGPDGVDQQTVLRLPGAFNVANAALAVAALAAAGVRPADSVRGIAAVDVPGRMERLRGAGVDDLGIVAIVDYAHTPDAVAAALQTLRPATKGRLVVVLGCGGERDRGKRARMGEVAARHADVLIVTDDNPRSEDPAAIRAAVLAGAAAADERGEVLQVGGRSAAIAEAVRRCRSGDTLLLAGKGHEQGQEVDGVVHPFDDRTELRRAIETADA